METRYFQKVVGEEKEESLPNYGYPVGGMCTENPHMPDLNKHSSLSGVVTVIFRHTR
jgi:hypothetical protein